MFARETQARLVTSLLGQGYHIHACSFFFVNLSSSCRSAPQDAGRPAYCLWLEQDQLCVLTHWQGVAGLQTPSAGHHVHAGQEGAYPASSELA